MLHAALHGRLRGCVLQASTLEPWKRASVHASERASEPAGTLIMLLARPRSLLSAECVIAETACMYVCVCACMRLWFTPSVHVHRACIHACCLCMPVLPMPCVRAWHAQRGVARCGAA